MGGPRSRKDSSGMGEGWTWRYGQSYLCAAKDNGRQNSKFVETGKTTIMFFFLSRGPSRQEDEINSQKSTCLR